jgi:hypothetical protein
MPTMKSTGKDKTVDELEVEMQQAHLHQMAHTPLVNGENRADLHTSWFANLKPQTLRMVAFSRDYAHNWPDIPLPAHYLILCINELAEKLDAYEEALGDAVDYEQPVEPIEAAGIP